eukprot:3705772-Pleurochrysis_carterae.AAC.1
MSNRVDELRPRGVPFPGRVTWSTVGSALRATFFTLVILQPRYTRGPDKLIRQGVRLSILMPLSSNA